MAPLVPVIRRYLSAALAVLVILVALVALVAQAVLERRTYDLDRSARVIDGALADPANREALDRSRRASDSYRPPGGSKVTGDGNGSAARPIAEDPRGVAKLSEGFRGRKKPSLPVPAEVRHEPELVLVTPRTGPPARNPVYGTP